MDPMKELEDLGTIVTFHQSFVIFLLFEVTTNFGPQCDWTLLANPLGVLLRHIDDIRIVFILDGRCHFQSARSTRSLGLVIATFLC